MTGQPPFHPRCGLALAIVFIALADGATLAAAPPAAVVVEDGVGRIELGGALRHLNDPGGELDWEDVLSPGYADDWNGIEGDVPNLGYNDDAHWFDVRLDPAFAGEKDYMLEVQYPLLDDVVFHVLRGGRLERRVVTGDRLPFGHRTLEHTTFVIPLELRGGEPCEVLLRIATSSAVQVPVVLWTADAFLGRVNHLYTINGIFYGVMISIMLYGLSLFITMRERNYLYFLGYIFSFTILMLAIDGMGYQYVWPDLPFLQEHMITVCLGAVTAAALLFAANFLHLAENSPRLSLLLRVLGGVATVATVAAWVVPYAEIIRAILMLPVLATVVVLAVATRLWRRGSRPAFLFCWAWIALLAGTCLMILAKLGLIPPSLLTENGPTLGMLAQAALMITAMAEDLKSSRHEQRAASEELLQVQEASSRKLREEVRRQTRQLQDMMRELAHVNEELDQHNKLDGLTGIFNRGAFDERLDMEHGRARRTGSDLSLLMVDIDLFKNVNDTYGHQAGDECLRQLAAVLEEESRRTTDFAARYGGEEFALILAETAGDAALAVAERVRAAVEAMPFEVEGVRVPITVSVGVGHLKPIECPEDCEGAVVAMADAALYDAKRNGRNRVEFCEVIQVSEPV